MYTRARTWKSLKAKILTAFASFALLLGAGAAVTTVAAQQQNEVVETKADAETGKARIYFTCDWSDQGDINWLKASVDNSNWTDARRANSSASYASHVYSSAQSTWVVELTPSESGSTLYSYFYQYNYWWCNGTGGSGENNLGKTIYPNKVYAGALTYVDQPDNNHKRWKVNSFSEVGDFAFFNFDGGTRNGSDPFDVIETKKSTTFSLLRAPTRSDWTFLGWRSSDDGNLHPARETHVAISSARTFTAAWARTTDGSGFIRIWFYRCGHYADWGTEWRLWDGVGGSTAVSPVEWVETSSGSNDYLCYYDVAPSWVGKKIVFQVFQNDDWQLQTVENEFTLSAGDNAYLLFPYKQNSVWHIGKGTAAKCASHDGNHNAKVDYNVLERVFQSYQTCTNDKSKGYANATVLANTWVWDSENATSSTPNITGTTSKSTAEDYLKNYTIFDYYYNNGSYNYSSVANKTRPTSLYDKYQAMLNMQAHGRVLGTLIPGTPTGTESPLTTTLWIVLGAGILGLGAIGTAYFVSKKKKRPQA